MKKRNLRLERRQQRWEENRRFILEAAERVFVQKGYDVATMDDIVEEVQFSKATLYRYYKSKRDILFEIILDSFETVGLRIRKIKEKDETAEEKLREITRFALQFFHNKKNISRVFLMERSLMKTILDLAPEKKSRLSQPETKFLERVRATKERMLEVLIEIFEEGIKEGEFRKLNSHDAAHAFEAMLHGFYFTKYWYENEYNIDTGTDLIQEFLLHGIQKAKNV
jgi:AcrR family transcriptional regulator